MFSKGKSFIKYSFNEILHFNTQEFWPSYYCWYIKILKISCTANSPLYLFTCINFSNVGPIFVKGEEISVKTEEGKHFARVSRSIHNLFRWLVGKMGIMTEVRPISELIIVFLPLFSMENRGYFKRGKKEKEKIRKYWGKMKRRDPARTRTWNPLIRSQMPYPLGHRAVTQQKK